MIFFQCLSDITSDILRENFGRGVQNVGHVRKSDDFSYTLGKGGKCGKIVNMEAGFRCMINYGHREGK